MLESIKTLLSSSNPDYIIEFEEKKMMNVKVDEYVREAKFVYIEEYITGKYLLGSYVPKKQIKFEIYFCKFTNLDNEAIERELLRNSIEIEMVLPFVSALRSSGLVDRNADIPFYYPLPRFDAHEVSIMLQIYISKPIC